MRLNKFVKIALISFGSAYCKCGYCAHKQFISLKKGTKSQEDAKRKKKSQETGSLK